MSDGPMEIDVVAVGGQVPESSTLILLLLLFVKRAGGTVSFTGQEMDAMVERPWVLSCVPNEEQGFTLRAKPHFNG